MYKYLFLVTCFFISIPTSSFSQNDWVLKSDKEGIKVYTKNLDNSPFKAIKTVFTIETSLTRLTAVLLDIDNSKDWVYSTKKCIVLKRNTAADLVYYSEISVPWPVSNRDFIVRLKVSQDEKTKVITVDGENLPNYLPANNNIERIQKSYSKWVITPLSNGLAKIEYVLQVDPGGSVPAWLINLFATKGPVESFKSLRLQVKKPIYNNVSLPFIRD